jgi:hypothetical protein
MNKKQTSLNFIQFLIFLGIIVFVILPARAGSKGDIELLRLVATAHQANRAKIRTWRGLAQIENTHEDANGVIIREKTTVDFLSDRRRAVTRWKWTHNEQYVRKGVDSLEILREPFTAMITREGYYRHAPGITTLDGERLNTLVIQPPEKARSGSYTDCFDPMWYLTGHMAKVTDDLVERLAFLYSQVKNDGVTQITSTRDGNLVILENKDGGIFNRHTFDLSQGGNVVKYEAGSDNVAELRTWSYEQVDSVWIPKTFVFSYQYKTPDVFGGTKRTRSITFVKNILNQPVDISEFSLESLGYSNSEQVSDTRSSYPRSYYNNRIWEQRLSQELQALPPHALDERLPMDFAKSLLKNRLPEFIGLGIKSSPDDYNDQMILICFFDIEQRPSRNCILQLTKRAQELQAKGVVVVAIQSSKIEQTKLKEWIKAQDISFPVGMVEGDSEKICFAWGVKSLPWLILTDRNHIVTAEGFSISELNEKIEKNVK